MCQGRRFVKCLSISKNIVFQIARTINMSSGFTLDSGLNGGTAAVLIVTEKVADVIISGCRQSTRDSTSFVFCRRGSRVLYIGP